MAFNLGVKTTAITCFLRKQACAFTNFYTRYFVQRDCLFLSQDLRCSPEPGKSTMRAKLFYAAVIVAALSFCATAQAQQTAAQTAPPAPPPASQPAQSSSPAASAPVQAVPGTAPTPRKNGVITAVQDQAVIVAKVLNLSTNQTLQWESIIQDSISQGIDIYLDDTLTDDDKKAAFIQLRANAITELRQLCTPVQQKLLDRMLAASKRDAKQIAEYAQLDQKIFMTLSLNDSQTDRWSAILQDTQQKGMDIFQNDDLTDDQKHAALIAVNKAAIAKLRLYLTPLQQKNLDRLASGI
jgi:hypothetical protein